MRGEWVYPALRLTAALVLVVATWFTADRAAELRALNAAVESFVQAQSPLRTGIMGLVRDATGGLITVGSETRDLERLLAQASRLHTENLWHAAALFVAIGLFVGVPMYGRRNRRDSAQHLLVASTVLLVLGVWAPLLTVTLHVEIPVLGRMMADSNTKGLLDTVVLFLRGENPVLGVVILVFCVVVPLIKTVWLQWLILAPTLSGSSAEWLSMSLLVSLTQVFS